MISTSVLILLSAFCSTTVEDVVFNRFSGVILALIATILLVFVYRLLPANSNISNISKNTNVQSLIAEIRQLNQLIDSHILRDIFVLKTEFEQVKQIVSDASQQLMNNFYVISEYSYHQQQHIQSLLETGEKSDSQQLLSDSIETTSKIRECGANAVRLLQFEDIVLQIVESGVQNINNLESFVSFVNEQLIFCLHNLSNENLDTIDKVSAAIANLSILIRNKHSSPARKAAHHVDMAEGGIELF